MPRFYYTVSSLSPNRPSLYVCLAKKVLGQVPTMQCFARQQWLKAAKGLAMAAGFMSSTGSQHLNVAVWQGALGRQHACLVAVTEAQHQHKARVATPGTGY